MESQYQDILKLLSSSSLFRGLEIPQLREIARKTRHVRYKSGQILIEEGLVNDKIILILQGLVKIYKITKNGKEIFLAIEKANDFLGVMNLHDKPSSATIETIQPTEALIFHKKDLIALLQTNPSLWERMYQIILSKVEEYREMQSIRLAHDLYQRTYLLLTFFAQFLENKTIMLSHESIADIVGATRPRVTEVLHLLRDARKITISSKKITILT